MSHETAKATRRRMKEDAEMIFPWRQIFQGNGVDVGAGDDPLDVPGCIPFDKEQGDAQFLSRYFAPESKDYIHASQCCEHLPDPEAAIRDWLTILKPGGYLVATVPDVGSYEAFAYPSRWNPDHRASFSMIYRGSKFPKHYHIPTWLATLSDVAEALLARYVETNFDWSLFPDVDQTWRESDNCEIWNEFVLKRR